MKFKPPCSSVHSLTSGSNPNFLAWQMNISVYALVPLNFISVYLYLFKYLDIFDAYCTGSLGLKWGMQQ